MGRRRVLSDNFCEICGRNTNNKKYGDHWINKFFVCNNCKKVWCSICFGQKSGLSQSKAHRLAVKGKVKCPECNSFIAMIRLPQDLSFKSGKASSSGSNSEFCNFCGEKLKLNSNTCKNCGVEQ